jgi:hypothetical protein
MYANTCHNVHPQLDARHVKTTGPQRSPDLLLNKLLSSCVCKNDFSCQSLILKVALPLGTLAKLHLNEVLSLLFKFLYQGQWSWNDLKLSRRPVHPGLNPSATERHLWCFVRAARKGAFGVSSGYILWNPTSNSSLGARETLRGSME